MIILEVSLCKDEKYFPEHIALLDYSNSISSEMTEDNVDKIKELLPLEHKNKLIIGIMRLNDAVIIKK